MMDTYLRKMNKKDLLRVLPYCASILAGLFFLFIGLNLNEDIKSLFISISAAFFAIPLIYVFYQVAQNLSQKRLNKEIFDYAKMQIDREILSIINQLQKIVYPLGERDLAPAGVSKFLSLEKDALKKVLSKNEYLGFQVLKKWDVSEEGLHEILKNSFILKSLENDQVISIISITKSLRYLESIQKGEELYVKTQKEATSYKIVAGKELGKENAKFRDRYLLIRKLDDNKSLVVDFGDFSPRNIDEVLRIFVVDQRHLEIYSGAIFDLIRGILNWVSLTGWEFVIDTKMFRPGHNVTTGN